MIILTREPFTLPPKTLNEKYGGRTIYFTSEKYLVRDEKGYGICWSCPTVRAFIVVNGKRKQVGEGITKVNPRASAHYYIKKMKKIRK